MIAPNPAALQLRYLQTLTEVGVNQNSTIVFPLPLDVIRPFLEGAMGGSASGENDRQAEPPGGRPAVEAGDGGEPLVIPSTTRSQRRAGATPRQP